jgi:hypothetical protein
LSSGRRVSLAAITTLAFCLVMAAAAAQANAALKYVKGETTTLNKDSSGTSRAACSDSGGMHVWGGGQYVLSGLFGANLTTSTPVDGKDRGRAPDEGWRSTVRNFDPGNLVTAFAICAKSPTIYVSDTTSVGPGVGSKTGRVPCQPGTKVVGGGATLPVSYDDGAWLESSAPFDDNDANSKPDDGWTATGGVEERKVEMKITAICVAKMKLRYVSAQGSAPIMNYGEAAATCPGDSHVTGGGMTSQGVAFHPMSISSPFDSGDSNARPDNGWQGEFDNYSNSDPGLITAYAICLV